MKIHSVDVSHEAAFANVELALVPDSVSKATALFTVFADPDGSTLPFTVNQSVESLAEVTTGGHVRVMFKTALKFPKIKVDPSDGTRLVFGPGLDAMPIHLVAQLPPALAQMFANEDPSTEDVRTVFAGLIAKALHDLKTIIQGADICDVALQGKTMVSVRNTMFAPTAPLRRAVASLQPLDTSTGVYGTPYAP